MCIAAKSRSRVISVECDHETYKTRQSDLIEPPLIFFPMSYGYPSSDTSSSISMTPATSSPPSAGLSSSTMSLSLPRILAAHAVCGAVATLILLPLGVLIPRYGRAFSKGRWWFPLHMVAQLIGVILAIAAMGTGYTMGGVDGTAHPVSSWTCGVFLICSRDCR